MCVYIDLDIFQATAAHCDVELADVSPQSHSPSALCLAEATLASPGRRAAGPSCAKTSDDQNEPSFRVFVFFFS